jgi:DNA-binding response OmpR family regulator
MKVLVVGMTPLPWKYYQALQSKHALQVSSVQKPFFKKIAKQGFDTTIIWSDKLSPLYTKKLCTHLHREFPALKTLVLGNHFSSLQRAELLLAGARDCMPDSVCTKELLARVRNAHAAAGQHLQPPVFSRANFQFRFKEKLATFDQTIIPLNKKETLLLNALLQKPDHVLSPQTLYSAVWDSKPPSSNSLEVYICALRRKIEKPFGLKLLTTFKGRGYGVLT